MVKIKVKFGACGIKYTDKNGNARHAVKTPENGAFDCDDAQAARLVKLGVAVYVGEIAEQKEDQTTGHLDTAQLESMTIAQLEHLAGDLGIDVSGCKKKADYIAAIQAEEVTIDGEDDGDELPELNAADPE